MPVAAPEDLEMVAVISPKPMFESENTRTIRKAKANTGISTFGLNPMMYTMMNTIAAWIRAIVK